jgi:hypothetical protein
MIRPKSLRQLAAYSISLPAFAVSPKLAKETVYMPSHVAAEMLGNRPETKATTNGELSVSSLQPKGLTPKSEG